MKTSLVIDDQLFRTARAEAVRQGKTISELLSYWARIGWETLRRQKFTIRSNRSAR